MTTVKHNIRNRSERLFNYSNAFACIAVSVNGYTKFRREIYNGNTTANNFVEGHGISLFTEILFTFEFIEVVGGIFYSRPQTNCRHSVQYVFSWENHQYLWTTWRPVTIIIVPTAFVVMNGIKKQYFWRLPKNNCLQLNTLKIRSRIYYWPLAYV